MLITQQHITTIVSMAKAYCATRLILFGSFMEAPEKAKDIDLACDGVKGWKLLYELAARPEEELQTPLDIIPLSPPTRFTRLIESKGKVLI